MKESPKGNFRFCGVRKRKPTLVRQNQQIYTKVVFRYSFRRPNLTLTVTWRHDVWHSQMEDEPSIESSYPPWKLHGIIPCCLKSMNGSGQVQTHQCGLQSVLGLGLCFSHHSSHSHSTVCNIKLPFL